MAWRISVEPAADGEINMGRDLRLAPGEARVYAWSAPSVSLGRFQRPEQDLLPDAPVQVVRRPTGGRAVLHGHDVTIGLRAPMTWIGRRALGREATPEELARLGRSVRTAYRAVVGPIVVALRRSGAPVALGEATRFAMTGPSRSADCFAHVAALDVVDDRTGAKVCGCALRLDPESVLVQASVPVAPPLVDPYEVFARPAAPSWVAIEPESLASALADALREAIE